MKLAGRINVSALEEDALRAVSDGPAAHPGDLSRRQVLGLAGATAVGAAPAVRAVESTLSDSFRVIEEPGRIIFRYRGADRWIIDVRRFAGRPRLSLTRASGRLTVRLQNARYAGTTIPADLLADIRLGLGGWRMTLRMGVGGFRSTVPFEAWLLGKEPAQSSIAMGLQTLRLDSSGMLQLGGEAKAGFSADWQLAFTGRRFARLSGFGGEIVADTGALRLLTPDEPSLLGRAPGRRSLIVLSRGRRRWSLDLPKGPAGSGFSTVQGGFDTIAMESGETARGGISRVLAASSAPEEEALLFHPSPSVYGSDRQAFGLPLSNIRYATSFSGQGRESTLVATYSQEPRWLHIHGCSLLVGRSEEAATFRLRESAGRSEVSCAPAVHGISGSLAGAVSEPVAPEEPLAVELHWERRRRPRAGRAHLRLHHPQSGTPAELAVPDYIVSILRPDDLLAVRLHYIGFYLQVGGGNPPQLVRNASDARMVAHFPPQNIAEQAFFEVDSNYPVPATDPDSGTSGNDPLPSPGSVAARISGPSRLGFKVPGTITTIPYTLEAVLDWSKLTQSVNIVADPPNGELPYINQPASTDTAIEAPLGLFISPPANGYWNHTSALVTTKNTTELWHTRLGVRDASGKGHDDNEPKYAGKQTIRAIYSPDCTFNTNPEPPDFPPANSVNPFRTSLDARDRYSIVRLTSDWVSTDHVGNSYTPLPAKVNRLMLTGLGAWIDVHGMWQDQPNPVEVTEWIHKGTMARDHYVKVAYAGYLWPFGFRATLIKVTERKFRRVPTFAPNVGPIIAYLFQRMYIQVRHPDLSFTDADYPPGDMTVVEVGPGTMDWPQGYAQRKMPFKSMKVTTLVTPDLVPPISVVSSEDPSVQAQDCFWPQILVNGTATDFLWHLKGTDWDGHTSEFTAPMIFVGKAIAQAPNNASHMNNVLTEYSKQDNDTRTTIKLKKQHVAFAPSAPTSSPNGTDPSLETETITFRAAVPQDPASSWFNQQPDQPQFFPTVGAAAVDVPAIKQLIGQQPTNPSNPRGSSPLVRLADEYLNYDFTAPNNKGEIFAHLIHPLYLYGTMESQQVPMVFGPGASGQLVTPGAITPNLSIAGLSRLLGPVGAGMNGNTSDLSQMGMGQFDPTKFFGDPSSLLGNAVPKILGGIPLTALLGPLPDFTQDLLKVPGLKIKQEGQNVVLTYDWLTDNLVDIFIFLANLVDDNGNPTKPASPPSVSPPMAPTVKDIGAGNVTNNGKNPCNHSWAATYKTATDESVVSIGTKYDVSANGAHSGGRKIKVTVNQAPPSSSVTQINIYRTGAGATWPFYLVGSITGSKVKGTGTATFTDNLSDTTISTAAQPHTGAQLAIDIKITVPLDGSTEPTYQIIGQLAYFSLEFGVLAIPFVGLKFIIKSGQKLKVEPDVNQIVFQDFLKFVNGLRSFLNSFSDPPFLDVTDTDIKAGYTLQLPTISVGAFSLQNISIGASIDIPFFGDAIVISFNFCTKSNMFVLTIYIFGGGGFVEIDMGPQGLDGLHAGLEFGVDVALDFGVASGGCHVMVGIYFDYDKPTNAATLTGFFDAGGNLEVLGMVSVSLDIHIQLSWQISGPDAGKVSGSATITLEIGLCFFSISVSIGPVKKSVGGSSEEGQLGPPHLMAASGNHLTVSEMISKQDWLNYVQAFAA